MLKDRCALISGSTQGLGYAMAGRLAAEGCNIVLNGFGDAQEIERKRRQLEQDHGVRALHHGADTMPWSVISRRSRRSSPRTGTALWR